MQISVHFYNIFAWLSLIFPLLMPVFCLKSNLSNVTFFVKIHLRRHHITLQEVSEMNIMHEKEALVGLDVGDTHFRTTAKPTSMLSKTNFYNSVAYVFNWWLYNCFLPRILDSLRIKKVPQINLQLLVYTAPWKFEDHTISCDEA